MPSGTTLISWGILAIIFALLYRRRLANFFRISLAAKYENRGTFLIAKGDIERAEIALSKSLRLAEAATGPNNVKLASILLELGEASKLLGKHVEAESHLKRAITLFRSHERQPGRDMHSLLPFALHELADVYMEQDRFSDAEPFFQEILSIQEKAYGPDDPDFAIDLDNLSELYSQAGEYTKAEGLLKRAQSIFEKTPDPSQYDVAVNLHMLAKLHRVQGRYAEAEQEQLRSLAIRERLEPAELEVGQSLFELAVLYRDTDRYAKSEHYFKRALAIFENLSDPDQSKADSELSFESVLLDTEDRSSLVQPNMAATLTSYSMLLSKIGRAAESKSMESRAKQIRTTTK